MNMSSTKLLGFIPDEDRVRLGVRRSQVWQGATGGPIPVGAQHLAVGEPQAAARPKNIITGPKICYR
jgi:hypothetical protein